MELKKPNDDKIRKIGVFCKPKAPSASHILGELIPLLRKQNYQVFIDMDNADIVNETYSHEKK